MDKENMKYEQCLLDDCFWYLYLWSCFERHKTEQEQIYWNYSIEGNIKNLLSDYLWGIHGNIWSILESIIEKHKINGHKEFVENNRNERFHLFRPRKETFNLEQVYKVYVDTCKFLKLRFYKYTGDWIVSVEQNQTTIEEPLWVKIIIKQLEASLRQLLNDEEKLKDNF